MDRLALAQSLQSLCESLDISITSEQALSCIHHLELVLDVNQSFNLTRITDVDSALVLHILDSLTLLPDLEQSPSGPVLDMGTGAGFPGIPLALVSGRSFTLVDSVGKKVRAVSQFLSALNLSYCSAQHVRLEELALSRRGDFSAVVARAVAPLPVLVEYAAPFLSHNGIFISSKGRLSAEELSSGVSAADICGLSLTHSSEFDLPSSYGHRTICVFQKTARPKIKLPRANGMAKHHPLA